LSHEEPDPQHKALALVAVFSINKGFGSASKSCGSASRSRVLKMNADPDPGPDFLQCCDNKNSDVISYPSLYKYKDVKIVIPKINTVPYKKNFNFLYFF